MKEMRVEKFFAIEDRIRPVPEKISVPPAGPGFSPAEPNLLWMRPQPLKLRLDVALQVILPLVLSVGALLSRCPAARAGQAGTDSSPAGNAQTGKKNFTSDGCYECHGLEGQGAMQTGAPRIGPPVLSLESFISYVRHPTNQMPPYTSKAISNQDLTDIYAYLKSIPFPPKGKDIPLLNK
jgi:mono/diheme cytochrome c family protein